MPTDLETANAQIVFVVAMARNRVIGHDNQLPWRLPGDLRHFKSLTLGKPVIMGRKTFASIGRPLPKRTNIVLTRSPEFASAGVLTAHDPEEALATAKAHAQGGEIMVIGGAQIYARLFPQADRIELTRVDTEVEGDAVFPPMDAAEWRLEQDREGAEATAENPGYRFQTYRRIR